MIHLIATQHPRKLIQFTKTTIRTKWVHYLYIYILKYITLELYQANHPIWTISYRPTYPQTTFIEIEIGNYFCVCQNKLKHVQTYWQPIMRSKPTNAPQPPVKFRFYCFQTKCDNRIGRKINCIHTFSRARFLLLFLK